MKGISIRSFMKVDWPEIKRIYTEGIQNGNATFETNNPELKDWEQSHISWSRIVAYSRDQVVGWAALSSVSDRCVYTGVAEVSIYMDKDFRGKGIGSQLLEFLITKSEDSGVWTLQAVVFPDNIASIKLLTRFGFRVVGTREKIGRLRGVWRDVILLERRSKIAGK